MAICTQKRTEVANGSDCDFPGFELHDNSINEGVASNMDTVETSNVRTKAISQKYRLRQVIGHPADLEKFFEVAAEDPPLLVGRQDPA